MNKKGAVLTARILTELKEISTLVLELSRGGKRQKKERTIYTWIVLP